MFQAKVGGKFIALCVLDSDVDTLATSRKEGLLSSAEENPWELEEEDSTLRNPASQTGFWVRTETATETSAIHEH